MPHPRALSCTLHLLPVCSHALLRLPRNLDLTVWRLSVGICMCMRVYSSSISQGLHILHTRHAQVEDLTWMTHNTYITKKVILPLR
jgi:hypothetical protein